MGDGKAFAASRLVRSTRAVVAFLVALAAARSFPGPFLADAFLLKEDNADLREYNEDLALAEELLADRPDSVFVDSEVSTPELVRYPDDPGDEQRGLVDDELPIYLGAAAEARDVTRSRLTSDNIFDTLPQACGGVDVYSVARAWSGVLSEVPAVRSQLWRGPAIDLRIEGSEQVRSPSRCEDFELKEIAIVTLVEHEDLLESLPFPATVVDGEPASSILPAYVSFMENNRSLLDAQELTQEGEGGSILLIGRSVDSASVEIGAESAYLRRDMTIAASGVSGEAYSPAVRTEIVIVALPNGLIGSLVVVGISTDQGEFNDDAWVERFVSEFQFDGSPT